MVKQAIDAVGGQRAFEYRGRGEQISIIRSACWSAIMAASMCTPITITSVEMGAIDAWHSPGRVVHMHRGEAGTPSWTELHTGGRLSARLLALHHDAIAAALGVCSIPLHPKKTVIVASNTP